MKVINLFAGPGCGKSTLAAGVFHQLKLRGINCELVTEFAKDLTWEDAQYNRLCQPYVFGVQYLRLKRLEGKVDYAITDSPLLLSVHYGGRETWSFRRMVRDYFHSFHNLNYRVLRPQDRPYQPIGRNQTEQEAEAVHEDILYMLDMCEVETTPLYSDEKGVTRILEDIDAQNSSL